MMMDVLYIDKALYPSGKVVLCGGTQAECVMGGTSAICYPCSFSQQEGHLSSLAVCVAADTKNKCAVAHFSSVWHNSNHHKGLRLRARLGHPRPNKNEISAPTDPRDTSICQVTHEYKYEECMLLNMDEIVIEIIMSAFHGHEYKLLEFSMTGEESIDQTRLEYIWIDLSTVEGNTKSLCMHLQHTCPHARTYVRTRAHARCGN